MRPIRSLALLIISLSATLGVLAPTPALAQHGAAATEAKLPPQLARFSALLGDWEGSGTVQMPGMPVAQEWTSVLSTKPVMGNQFIQSEMRIDMKGSNPVSMIYRAYYGWDPKREKLVSFSVGNSGEIEVAEEVVWLDDHTLVVEGVHTEAGVPSLQRSINRYTADTYTFTWEIAHGATPMTVRATGSYTRADTEFSISAGQWANAMVPGAPAPPQMKKVAGMVGDYTMTGEATMVPGMPAMEISGRETIESLFGGSVLKMEVIGDPIPGAGEFRYHAIGFIGYVARDKVFRQFYISNMGEIGTEDLYFVDDHTMVHTSTAIENGKPVVTRSTVYLDEKGGLVRSTSDQLRGASSLERVFTGEFVKQPD